MMEEQPTLIDLYAGVGGLSLGAARAGFLVKSAVEIDKFAIETHKKNFPNSRHIAKDVSTLTGNELLYESGLQLGQLDCLIGGPPCQGFSFIGKKNVNDNRNSLFIDFFRIVHETKPKFFLVENVPGIKSVKYTDIVNKALNIVRNEYEIIGPITVKANLYGAPTSRTRVFFIGYDQKKVSGHVTSELFAPLNDTQPVYVIDALKGLPVKIKPEWQHEKDSWQRLSGTSTNHYSEFINDKIPNGVGDLDTIRQLHKYKKVSGCFGTLHAPEIEARYGNLKCGETDPISRSVRLSPYGFCPTLRAGTGSDKGSFQAVRPIHYSESRVITPREAARLQGFPDWFLFHPTKWHSFRQIGNSVSPIVAEHMLRVIKNHV